MGGDSSDLHDRAAGGTQADSLDEAPPRKRALKLERGRTIGRYVVLYELGAGGMGVVYAAYDPELDRKIALKLLHADSTSSRGRQRLMREAQAIAKLTHPNVVTVHDVGTYEGRVFVAMEFIDGVTLRHWLRERVRRWPEVLEVMRAAGEGLAAAHAADLVHRDFKPDNVLVDRTGRVVVLDFGLARRAQSHSDDSSSGSRAPSRASVEARVRPDPDGDAARPGRPGDLDVDLTRTGALLGTPAYMAPEQHLGNHVDARSDQFAFCVVAWEALFGVRPFRGDTATATAMNVVKGLLQEPPKGSGVPTWLRRVLTRGLAVEANTRYPNMHALLAALRRDATMRTRRRFGVFAGIAGVGLGAALAYVAVRREPTPCVGGPERLAGVWDDDVRSRVRAVFDATGVTYADTAFAGVQQHLDGYTARWLAQYRDACEATHVHFEQSQDLLDLRMGCLRARLGELAALTAEFEAADASVVEHAVEAAADLGRLEGCDDTRALAARVAPPADAPTRERVEALRARLTDARAKEAAGRYGAALAIAEDVAASATHLEYPPVLAEARLRLGSALERTGDFAAAERALLESIWHAEASRHEDVAADAWVRLVWVSGVERGDTAAGEMWAQFADAAVRRIGSDELLRATLVHNRGGVLYRQGRLDEAFARYSEALDAQLRLLGPDDPQVAMSLNHLGNVRIEQGDLDGATPFVTRSYELRRRVLGARHPKVAASLNNLAVIAAKQGDHALALERAEQALDIVGGSGGNEELVSLTIAADAAPHTDRPEAGSAYLERLLALHERASPPQPAAVALTRTKLALDHEAHGRHDDAIAQLEAAAALRVPLDGNAAARLLLEVVRIHRALGRRQLAEQTRVRAQRLADAAATRDPALHDAIVAAAAP